MKDLSFYSLPHTLFENRLGGQDLFRVDSINVIPLHMEVAKHWETIVEKLKSAGWEVRWIEAMHDGESGWTATAVRGKERHSTHANDITLAFQELDASCLPRKDRGRPLPRE